MPNDLLETKLQTIRYLQSAYGELVSTLGSEILSMPTRESLLAFYLHYAQIAATAPSPIEIKESMANTFVEQAIALVSSQSEHESVYLTKANVHSVMGRKEEADKLFLELRTCTTPKIRVAANVGLCNRAIEAGNLLELQLCVADIEADIQPDNVPSEVALLLVISMSDRLQTSDFVRLLKALRPIEILMTPKFWDYPIFDRHRDAPEFQELLQVF